MREDVAGERGDLLGSLAKQRYFLRYTVRDLTDEQAARQTTASELCLGGVIKHVALTERQWINFILDGPSAMGNWDEASVGDWTDAFRMLEGETLSGMLEEYEQVAHRTDGLVAPCPTWRPRARCPTLRGSSRGRAGPRAGCCSM
jgi:Protein of unknown function (DUF664)